MRLVGWHHRLYGHELEQTLGDGGQQQSLVCCSPWGRKELDTTKRLDNSNKRNVKTESGLDTTTSGGLWKWVRSFNSKSSQGKH